MLNRIHQDMIDQNFVKKVDDLGAEMAQISQSVNVIDFVKELQTTPTIKKKFRTISDRTFEVFVPIDKVKHVGYEFRKDANDDFSKLNAIRLVDLVAGYEKNYDSTTGAWNKSLATNYFTQEIGASFTATFEGSGFGIRHYADNRGGIWEFVIDGDTANPIQISTYDAVGIANKLSVVTTTLADKEHTVVGTFKGDDPLNPPSGGAGTSRGWLRFDEGANPDRRTFVIYGGIYFNPTNVFDFILAASNIEFALTMKPTENAGSTILVPDHGTGTAFAVKQNLIVDGMEVTSYPLSVAKEVDNVSFTQVLNAMYPSDPIPMAEITLNCNFNSNNYMSTNGHIKYLRNCTIGSGYIGMFPASTSFGNMLLTSLRNKYATTKTDGSTTYLNNDKDNAYSFLFLNSSDKQDYVLAMTIHDVMNTFRKGKSGRLDPLCWIQHRADGYVQKLYPQVYSGASMVTGEVHYFSFNLLAGRYFNALDIFDV